MNVFIGTGEVTNVNLLTGERKMLKFTLAILGNNSDQTKERIDYVPCIIYNPTEEVKRLLIQGRKLELQGRVQTYSFEIAGETTSKTQVVINQRSLKILD